MLTGGVAGRVWQSVHAWYGVFSGFWSLEE
jgi:hypothetical protein